MLHGLFQVPAQQRIYRTFTGSLQQGCPSHFDSTTNPKLIMIKIKQSKTDPFRRGITLYLGRTELPLCPVLGILPFKAIRGKRPGPLFILKDGRMFTRQIFSSSLDTILEKLQLNSKQFNTHSFQIGVATSAKAAGIDDNFI